MSHSLDPIYCDRCHQVHQNPYDPCSSVAIGLEQSARGETVSLGSFASYATEEIRFDVGDGKRRLNHHIAGYDCWCKPIETKDFLIHRNYEWRDGKWHLIQQ